MPRKKQEEHVNHERWLVSYADFVTLLFAFFVVMFATSQTDKSKAQAVSDSVKKALEGESFNSVVNVILGGTIDRTGQGNAQKKGPGGDVQPAKPDDKKSQPMVELMPSLDILTKQLAPEIKAGKLQISMVPRGLAISFTQAALFPSGDDEIAQETYPSIKEDCGSHAKDPESGADGRPHRRDSNPQFALPKQLGTVRGPQHRAAGVNHRHLAWPRTGSPSAAMATRIRWTTTTPNKAAQKTGAWISSF